MWLLDADEAGEAVETASLLDVGGMLLDLGGDGPVRHPVLHISGARE
jgi:hypothetical protein